MAMLAIPERAAEEADGTEDQVDAPCGRLEQAFRRFIADAAFPCVGAKGALAHEGIRIQTFGPLDGNGNDALLLDRLEAFAAELVRSEQDTQPLRSFAALFEGPDGLDERGFESLLWAHWRRRWRPGASAATGCRSRSIFSCTWRWTATRAGSRCVHR